MKNLILVLTAVLFVSCGPSCGCYLEDGHVVEHEDGSYYIEVVSYTVDSLGEAWEDIDWIGPYAAKSHAYAAIRKCVSDKKKCLRDKNN